MSEFTPEEVEALRLSLACEPRMVESATVLALISSYQRLASDTLTLSDKLSRAVVVEGEQTPVVLEAPAELGMEWHDGGDMLALLDQGITIFPGGADEWVIPPAQAREMAAQLAAMADAREAAQAQTGGDDA